MDLVVLGGFRLTWHSQSNEKFNVVFPPHKPKHLRIYIFKLEIEIRWGK